MLTSPSPAPKTSGYKRYQDDAVTSKTPVISEDESSDNDDAMPSVPDTPTASDTESDEREVVELAPTDQHLKTNLTKSGRGEVMEFTPTDQNPKGKSTRQKSNSLELNLSQAGRALETFKIFNSQELKQKPAQIPKNVSEETEKFTQKELAKKRGWPRKRTNLAAGANLDADYLTKFSHLQIISIIKPNFDVKPL